MILFLSVLSAFSLGLGLFLSSKYRNNEWMVFWCGMALILVGAFSGLYMYLGDLPKRTEQVAFLTTYFAVITSVGTNLLANSAFVGGSKNKGVCSCSGNHVKPPEVSTIMSDRYGPAGRKRRVLDAGD